MGGELGGRIGEEIDVGLGGGSDSEGEEELEDDVDGLRVLVMSGFGKGGSK